MDAAERRRSGRVCGFDRLESRALLNAHLPSAHGGHIEQVTARVPAAITGTLNGVNPYTTDPSNPNLGADTYSTSGRTNAGYATLTGQDTWTGAQLNATKYRDLYYSGDLTLTLSNGSVFRVAYTGNGKSSVNPGPYTETMKGTAIGVSGAVWNKTYTYVATGSGPGTTEAITMKIKLTRS